jgi:hypothetical protein
MPLVLLATSCTGTKNLKMSKILRNFKRKKEKEEGKREKKKIF